jgi:hypothetical protein
MIEMLKPPSFKQSRDTQIIYGLFREINQRKDPVVTWNEICEATGKRKQRLSGAVATAIKRSRRDDGIVVESDRGIGYRLRKDAELNQSGSKAIERSRTISRVGLEKLKCGDREQMNVEQRAEFDVNKTVLEMNVMTTNSRIRSSTKQMVMRKHNELNEQEQLQAIADALAGK